MTLSSNCERAPEPIPASATLEALFDDCFGAAEHTLLRGGADEPLYIPSLGSRPAVIHYRYDYPASALHEVAHWCIAGVERRKRVDYGYWYAPDGRDDGQQRAFLDVEARPQALEWIFSRACGLHFRPSLDNLDTPPGAQLQRAFAERIAAEARAWTRGGLTARAARFHRVLCDHFPQPQRLREQAFAASALV